MMVELVPWMAMVRLETVLMVPDIAQMAMI
jgi:hypothetical protein